MIVVWLVFLVMMLLAVWVVMISYGISHIRSMRRSGGVPYVGSFDHHITLLRDHQDLIPPGSTVYDLWCGDGKMLRFFAKYRDVQGLHGRDIHSVAIRRGRILTRIYWHKSIHLHHGDFFELDIDRWQADVVYCYLLDTMMDDAALLLAQKLHPDTITIVNTFPLPQTDDILLTKTITDPKGKERFFIYQKT